MKIIIAYASAGTGHFKAAQAIYFYLKEHAPGLDVQLVDILETSDALFKISYKRGYSFLVRFAPFLWAFAFHVTSIRSLQCIIRAVASLMNRASTKRFVRILQETDPTFIISTHFLPSEIASFLKTAQKINSRIITVVTDFGVHPFWISPGTDIYIAASSYTKTQLLREGVREGQIKEFGIPIEEKFSRTYDRTELCRTFGFKPRSFTVLISTGSFGIGPIERIVASLCLEAQLLVVCANNKRLYARLKARNYPQVRVFGFIDNIEELMAISDVIIAKPGGLTIAESLAMGLFPFFVIAIPGQEAENAKALSSFGIGLYSKDTSLIIDSVLRLKYHPDACRRARELTQRLKRPFSTKELCSVIRESSIRPSH